MATKSKTPQIRFKGFSGEWEEKILDDIADIVGGGTPSTTVPDYWNGDIDWYSPTEIGKRIYANGSVKKITQLGLEKSSAKILPSNKTILFTSRAGIGDMAILNKDGATNQGFQSLVLKDKHDTYFVYSVGYLIKEYALKYSSGSTFLEISGKQLSNMTIRIPSFVEQTKIGYYFQHLDKLIEQKEKKYQKLRQFKKAMLDKMFPKHGDATPEIRFKGFSGEWNLGKVSNLLRERNIQTPKSDKYPLMAFVANKGVSHKGDRYNREFLVNDEENKKYKQTEYGDFIYSSNNLETGSIGLNNYGSASISPVYSIFQPTELGNSDFVGRLLIRKNFINQMIRWRQGVVYGQWRIHESDFLKIEVKYPTIEEQAKIGNYFKELDLLIDLHLQELQKLKNIKKASLEKMFV